MLQYLGLTNNCTEAEDTMEETTGLEPSEDVITNVEKTGKGFLEDVDLVT